MCVTARSKAAVVSPGEAGGAAAPSELKHTVIVALAATVPVLQGCRPLILSASERGCIPRVGGRWARWSRDLPFLSEVDLLDVR